MRRLVLALLLGALVLGAPAAPVAADSGSITDERGDAPSRIDVTGLHVENGNRWFSMRVEVRNLRQKGKFEFSYERGRREYGEMPNRGALIFVHRVAGETRARYYGCGTEDCSAEPGEGCARLRVSWRAAKDVIRVAAPQACLWWLQRHPKLSPPRRATFHVYAYLGEGPDDASDLVVVDRG